MDVGHNATAVLQFYNPFLHNGAAPSSHAYKRHFPPRKQETTASAHACVCVCVQLGRSPAAVSLTVLVLKVRVKFAVVSALPEAPLQLRGLAIICAITHTNWGSLSRRHLRGFARRSLCGFGTDQWTRSTTLHGPRRPSHLTFLVQDLHSQVRGTTTQRVLCATPLIGRSLRNDNRSDNRGRGIFLYFVAV